MFDREPKKIPIVSVDGEGEGLDVSYTLGGTKQGEPKVDTAPGVPPIGTPEFDAWLKEKNRTLKK